MSKMNKSILVIDTPDACCECPLQYKAELISLGNFTYKQHYGCRCIPENIEDYCIPDVFSKPDWCPLSHLPEKKDLKQYVEKEKQNIENGDCSLDNVLAYHYAQGYNSCLDDILEGE